MSDFLGVPVTGEVHHYTTVKTKQDDPAKLLEALNKVLDHPLVEAVRWHQYTPYFNDGEACEFSIYEANVKVRGADEDNSEYSDGYYSTFGLGYYEETKDLEGVDSLKDVLEEFSGRLSSGAHYDILTEKFGDPAEVTATKEGFSIEYYEHD